jgi:hypothetical protein
MFSYFVSAAEVIIMGAMPTLGVGMFPGVFMPTTSVGMAPKDFFLSETRTSKLPDLR